MKKSLLIMGAALMMLGAVSCSGGDGAVNKDLTDREVLTLIYEQMNGAKWAEDTAGWCSDKPLSEWEGVEAETIDGVERVVGLKLNDDSLKGNIPAEIVNLTELKELSFYTRAYDADITNAVPAGIFSMAKLEDLRLFIHGKGHYTLPTEMNLPAIKQLHITRAEGPFDVLCNLTTLEELQMFNFKGAIPENIGNLANLETLWWETSEDPQGRVPASINKLSKLEHIQIDYTNGIAGGVKAADAPFPVEVWDIPTLQYVFLRCVASQPSTLPAEKIAAMKELKNVTIIDCGIEGTIPAEMFTSPKLYSFSIYRCNLTGEIPAAIGNCPELSTINLSYNKLSGTIPATIGKCTKLFTLSLEDNAELGGSLPASLASCEKLSMFSVKNTKVSQDVPAALKSHANFSKWRLF
ncbi:MAG: hypothetical protein KBT09_06050 [Bacteroidales bacterium]|nr:hypothetical protein [Candidatus Sodaliphilus fimicaballi]